MDVNGAEKETNQEVYENGIAFFPPNPASFRFSAMRMENRDAEGGYNHSEDLQVEW
jgi:hypothetical protein